MKLTNLSKVRESDYTAPEIQVIGMNPEGVLCSSNDQLEQPDTGELIIP